MKQLSLNIPTAWKQLTDKQLLALSKIMNIEQPAIDLQAKALIAFCGIKIIKVMGGRPVFDENGQNTGHIEKDIVIRHKRRYYHLKDWQLLAAEKQLDWLQQQPMFVRPLSKIKGFIPVNSILSGTPFKLWLAAENYYQAFLFTKDITHLHNLIAVLYSAGKDFNDGETTKRARKFRRCSEAEKNSVMLWYMSVKNVHAEKFPHLFQMPSKSNDPFADEPEAPQMPNMRETIDNMLCSLSGGDITKYPAIYNSETWAALGELNRKALEYQKILENQRKA